MSTTADAQLQETFAVPVGVPILPNGCALWGTLEKLEPAGGGLLKVAVSGIECLVDDSLQEKLAGRMGKQVTAVHVCGQWGAGSLE